MFKPEQVLQLEAPLSSSHVKKRENKYSYIEGWHAIAEANRIFGFGNWSRETVDLKCVSEREREIGKARDPGWGVTYIAKVRVTVTGEDGRQAVREGAGSGHGIDRDLGQAHESALKEAETDAMKRAFMTFGNPFGLALYDKEQSNVISETPPQPLAQNDERVSQASDWAYKSKDLVLGFKTREELDDWHKRMADKVASIKPLAPNAHASLLEAIEKRQGDFNPLAAE